MKYMRLRHKYNAVPSNRDNIKFPSKLERDCYDVLKDYKTSKNIRFFLRQIPFDIPGSAKHNVDFEVFTHGGVYFVEAKGRDLAMGKLKRLQVEEIYDIDIHVVTTPTELKTLLNKWIKEERE